MSKSSDQVAITATIQKYLDGAKSGKGGEMTPAFHPDATIFGYIGADLFSGPIQKLFDWNDGNGAATELRGLILKGCQFVGSRADVLPPEYIEAILRGQASKEVRS